jgi:hypothetical protein
MSRVERVHSSPPTFLECSRKPHGAGFVNQNCDADWARLRNLWAGGVPA